MVVSPDVQPQTLAWVVSPDVHPQTLALELLRSEAEAARAQREASRAEADAAAERARVEAAIAAPLHARIRSLEEALEVSDGWCTGDQLDAHVESCGGCC